MAIHISKTVLLGRTKVPKARGFSQKIFLLNAAMMYFITKRTDSNLAVSEIIMPDTVLIFSSSSKF